MTGNIKKVKAEITTVKLGIVELEGLLSETGEFGVAVPQVAQMFPYFQDSQEKASQKLKRLMGKDFKTHKITTPFNRNTTLMVDLDGFVQVIKALAKKQDTVALDLMDILVGLSLHQLFCDAFQIKFEVEERLAWVQERAIGKAVRRTLTDAIKDYLETNETPEEYQKWVYSNATELVNLGIFNRRANQLRKDWDCKNPRDKMTKDELRWVLQVEELAMRLIDNDGLEPIRALREAVNRLCIPVVRR